MSISSYNEVKNCIWALNTGLTKELEYYQKHRITTLEKRERIPSCYSIDKALLITLFENTSSKKFQDIYTRLLALDSTYSTQMTKRYYGIGELAETIYLLTKISNFSSNLKAFARNPSPEEKLYKLFSYNKKDLVLFVDRTNDCDRSLSNLFDEKYGIGKLGEDKGISISLITKYAYFETGFMFPIYDSIANGVAPIIWEYCGGNDNNDSITKTSNIAKYITGINVLKEHFGVNYDNLDCFLWHLGKLMRGNLSLIFSMEEYIHFYNRIEKGKLKEQLKNIKDENNKMDTDLTVRLLTGIASSKITAANKDYYIPTIKLAIKLLKQGYTV